MIGPGALLVLAGSPAAHERWVEHTLLRDFDRTLFQRWDVLHSALLLAMVGVWVAFGALGRTRKLPELPSPRRFHATPPVFARLGLGVCLVVLGLGGQFIAPDLVFDASREGALLRTAACTLGGLLILGWQTRPAALGFSLVFLWALLRRPFLHFDDAPIEFGHVLVYFELLGIAAYLVVACAGPFGLVRARDAVRPQLRGATRLLQAFIGLNVASHGVMKLLSPELPMGVVQNYTEQIYDPVRALVPISEEGFVLAAGAAEIFLGSSILLGILPCLSMLAVLATFLMTTWVFRGDLVGHLPRIGAMLALLLGDRDLLDRRAEWLVDDLWGAARRRFARTGIPARVPARWALVAVGAAFLALTLSYGHANEEPAPSDSNPSDATDERDSGQDWLLGETTRGLGLERVLRFELAPLSPRLRVGEVFTLRLCILDESSGQPWLDVEDLRIDVTMPRHGHGMETLPELSATGDGWFELAGCQFNMHGLWRFAIEVEDVDRIAFDLRYRALPAIR